MLIFYVPGNKRKHVAPDVFVVRGVSNRNRDNYLVWEEGKSPDTIVEVTSKTTRKEDTDKKFKIYRDVLRVGEYFLCDPRGDYLHPKLQGHRLVGNDYEPIDAIDGRLPSAVMGLHLEPTDVGLRLFDPATGRAPMNPLERMTAEADRLRQQVEELKRRIPPVQ
jgi:Uma2 family endonuclease